MRDCSVSLWSQCLNTFVVNRSDWGSESPGRIAREISEIAREISGRIEQPWSQCLNTFVVTCMKPK